MRLSDFFHFNDLVRVILIGSAMLFLVGGVYGIFLHAMYASQIDTVRGDLLYIGDLISTKSTTAYAQGNGEQARELKEVAAQAKELSKQIRAPPVTPHAYTYLNYWIASAAFTELTLNPKILGLPDETVEAFQKLDSSTVLGEQGWWGRQEFYGFDTNSGGYRVFLESKPKLQSHFWSFYIAVFLIAFITIFVAVKEEYTIPIIPQIIYGIFLPVLFFTIYSLTAIISLSGVIKFLDPSQVDIFVLMLSFVIMSILSAFAAMIVGVIKSRGKKE